MRKMPDGPLKETDIAIRLDTSKADELEAALRARYPGILLSRGPLETDRALRLIVTFYTPQDEDLSSYHWVHSIGAGVDAICKRLAGEAALPLVTRTTGRMGEQIGEYCAAYTLAHLQKMALRRTLEEARDWDRERAAPAYLFETKVAVIGTGAIGQGIAGAFKGLGAPVLGLSRTGRPAHGFDAVMRLEDFSAHTADVVDGESEERQASPFG